MAEIIEVLNAGGNAALIVFAWVLLKHEIRLTKLER